MKRLKKGGTVIFSENFRGFSLDKTLKGDFAVKEITRDTIDPDFVKRGKAHRCWEISLP
jgi:23S rRNA (guanine2445-N2)-methyltransferase / 23S rRNA (guanine2069-N7)-methyltransferase